MKRKILNLASKKFKQLSKKYNKFINVIVDDWRGYRFIFDTKDVRKCNNNCRKCQLYQLLKSENNGIFSISLYLANKKDKKLFGKQKYLNCKSINQYKDCYINFLLQEVNTKKDITKELELIRNLKIIYSKYSNTKLREKKFKKSIINKVLKLCDNNKKRIIKYYIKGKKKFS